MLSKEFLERTNHEIEVVNAEGHENITARHKTTFEITKDPYLTPRGDCIIGVKADKALSDFNPDFKKLVKNRFSVVIIFLKVNENTEIIVGHGNEGLMYTDDRRIIIRKSMYIDPATAVVKASKAAIDLDRHLINDLRKGAKLTALFLVISFDSIDSINKFMRSIINNRSDRLYTPPP